MIPLIDIPNHRQPQKLDSSDFVTFNFLVQEKNIKAEDGTSKASIT
jgi:hypothetical protein